MTKGFRKQEFSSSELGSFFLKRNLAAIERRWPELSQRIYDASSEEVILIPEVGHLYGCRIGSVRIHNKVAEECVQLRETLHRALQSPDVEIVYVLGSGLGYMLAEIFQRTMKPAGPSTNPIGLVLLEHRLDLFRAMLRLNDWTEFLSSPRVFLCVGEDFLETSRAIRKNHHLDACTRPSHTMGRPLQADERELYHCALREADEGRREYHNLKQKQQERLRERYRTRPSPVRKIWSSVSIDDRAVQYIVRGLMAAL
ncbi:MAG: hypothetical protein ABIH23_27350, partial [bacterium]